jgi:putative membrane protein
MEILSLIVAFLVAALVIWIVGKLNLGMTVDGYVPAMIAAAAIAIIAWLISFLFGWLIPNWTGWMGAIVNLIVAALVILLSGRFVPGMKVNGFVGAIVAAISIAVVAFLINWMLSLFGITPVA